MDKIVKAVIEVIEGSPFLVVVIIFAIAASPLFFMLFYTPFREWFFSSTHDKGIDTLRTKTGMIVTIVSLTVLVASSMLTFILPDVQVSGMLYTTFGSLAALGAGVTLVDPIKFLKNGK